MDAMTTTREFRKHNVLGEIYAVEFMEVEGKRDLLGARRCTRAEELTAGALPVLTLHSSGDDREFYERNAGEFTLWEPPPLPVELTKTLSEKIEARDKCAADYNLKRKAERASLKALEKAGEDVFVAARQLAHPPEPKPLIRLAEGEAAHPPAAPSEPAADVPTGELSPEDFDAAFGDPPTDDDDNPDEAAPSDPIE